MENKIWYIVVKGKPEGPFTPDEIKEKLDKTEISPADLVFRPGFSKWVPLIEVKEFDRRNVDNVSNTAAGFQIPNDPTRAPTSIAIWVLLVKTETKDGKHHYIESGPYSTDQIQEKLKAREVKLEDHLWKEGLSQWTPIHQMSEFDRRGRKDSGLSALGVDASPAQHGSQSPLPTFMTSTEPIMSESATVITSLADLEYREQPKQAFTPAVKKIIPEKPTAITPRESAHSSEEATVIQTAMPSDDGFTMQEMSDDESFEAFESQPLMGRAKAIYERLSPPLRRKAVIALGGSLLAMVFTYAGLRAYQQHAHFPPPLAVIPPTAPPVVGVPGAMPPPVVQQPVGLAIQQMPPPGMAPVTAATPWPFTIRAEPSGNQVLISITGPFETNDEVTMTLKAVPGLVPGLLSYEMQKPLLAIGPKVEWPLMAPTLKAGVWIAEAHYKTKVVKTRFTFMTQTPQYVKTLSTFKKTYARQKQAEEKLLLSEFKDAYKWLKNLEQEFKMVLGRPSPASQNQWHTRYAAFRKWQGDLKHRFRTVTPLRKSAFVYPDALLSFKTLVEKMNDTASAMNKRLHARRDVASFDDMVETSLSATHAQSEYVLSQLEATGVAKRSPRKAKRRSKT